jgi:hypothetical protein
VEVTMRRKIIADMTSIINIVVKIELAVNKRNIQ